MQPRSAAVVVQVMKRRPEGWAQAAVGLPRRVQPESSGRLVPSEGAPQAPDVVLGRRWSHQGPHVAVRRPHVVVRVGRLRYLQAVVAEMVQWQPAQH